MSIDPKIRIGTDADDVRTLKDLIREAGLVIEAALHSDGAGDIYQRNWRSAWRFVRKVAKIKREE